MTNDVRVSVDGLTDELNVIGFDVRQDATPIAPGDSSGSVGSITVTARGITDGPPSQRTGGVIGRTLTLNDTTAIDGEAPIGHGLISGKVTGSRTSGEVVTLEADTLLARLNTDRSVPPFFGAKQTAPLITARDNLSSNPRYTAGAGTSSVTAGTGAMSGAVVASGGVNDSPYYAGSWTTASTAAGSLISSDTAAVIPNATFTGSAYVRYTRAASTAPGAPAQRVVLALRFYTAANAVISTATSAAFVLNQGEWTRAGYTATAPANAAYLRVLVITAAGTAYVNPGVGDEIAITQILVEQSSTLGTFFDGSYPDSTWSGTPGLSSSSLRAYGPVPSPNYDATIGNAFRYYCALVGIPETQIIVDPVFEDSPVAYPAWSGNVWVKIKELCAAIGGEVVADAELIYLRDIRRYELNPETFTNLTVTVNGEASSQFTEIYNYNTRWLTDSLVWSAPSPYSIDTGEIQYQSFTVEHSLTSVNSPLPVQQMPMEFEYSGGTGLYVIRDSEDKLVNPSWWTDNGGKITASLVTGSYNEITLVIKAPTLDTTTYKAPYSVGDNASDNPGIFITGSGVFVDKQVVRVATGAGPSQTSTIESSTINNIFLGDIATTRDRGALAAGYDGGPVVTLTATIPTNTPVVAKGTTNGTVSFGTLAGSRIKAASNVFRVKSASPNLSGIEISGIADMTFDDLTELFSLTFDEANLLYSGMTFDVFNALWSPSLTFNGFDALQPSATFDEVNAIFEGMDFNQHTVTPYIEKVISVDYESLY